MLRRAPGRSQRARRIEDDEHVERTIPLAEDDETHAWFDLSRGTPRALCVLGHGAGGRATDPVLVHLSERLAARDITCVRFDHLYRTRGRKLPDRMPQLVATFRAVLEDAITRGSGERDLPILLGGKSMSCRVAAQLAQERDDVLGLVFLGYPLVPPRGRADAIAGRRDLLLDLEPRPPMLFLTGTRDTFAPDDSLERLVADLGACATLRRIAGADHGFAVRKKDGRTSEDVRDELATRVLEWLAPRLEDGP